MAALELISCLQSESLLIYLSVCCAVLCLHAGSVRMVSGGSVRETQDAALFVADEVRVAGLLPLSMLTGNFQFGWLQD